MRIDIDTLLVIMMIIITSLSVLTVTIGLIAIRNGSVRRYKQKRAEHYQQFYQIQDELQRRRGPQ